jgi:hypothetical protein
VWVDERSELVREVTEEIGASVQLGRIRFMELKSDVIADTKKRWAIASYVCKFAGGTPEVQEPGKIVAIHWMDSFTVAPERMSSSCRQSVATAREKGTVAFTELNLAAQETLLTRRFFEMDVKSKNPALKASASERNRAMENTSILEQGDFVHAAFTPAVLEQILDHGIQCGEAVMDNTRTVIDRPFTVSFLKINESIASEASVPEKMDKLGNQAYGAINIVLSRDPSSTGYGTEQGNSDDYQYQIFGGVPSTEIKSIVLRESLADADTLDGIVSAIAKNGMFIPIYSASTGELLFSSEQYDQLRVQEAQAQPR